jgi:LysM repeat protein
LKVPRSEEREGNPPRLQRKRIEVRARSQVSKLSAMLCADNLQPLWFGSVSPLCTRVIVAGAWLWTVFVFGLTGCDRLGGSRYVQLTQDADSKSAQGDFERAINLYEAALDDSESIRSAEIHYKLALLYDDKLNDPVSALHHFKRYLALSPNGPHAKEVTNSIKHDEVAALTALSGDSVIPRSEAAQLRNENLNLRKELEARTGSSRITQQKSQTNDKSSKKSASKKAGRTYVVQSGDTLFSISRKFYKSPKRWKEILSANEKNIRDPKKLTVGETLVIP